MARGWIGVDFDGTLADYSAGWQGELEFGKPIPAMVARIVRWLDSGYEVRIVTARAFAEGGALKVDVIEALEQWLEDNIGQKLPITCSKDLHMIELWDDRCVQVIQNTGEPVIGSRSRV